MMPRRPRICPAKTCFHVLNRAVARLTLFEKAEDYEAFERVLVEAVARWNDQKRNDQKGTQLIDFSSDGG